MRVEQVNYSIKWSKFQVGASFFIPCLNQAAALKRIERAMRKHKFRIVHKFVIEDGIRGVRVWRVTT